MSSVSVHHAGSPEALRGTLERALLWVLRRLLPPANDNQTATDHLYRAIGKRDPHVQWVVVRPDTLLEGDVTQYALSETLVSSLFKPASTNMANIAHFMCELVTDAETWNRWAGRLPVIFNANGSRA